MSRWISVFIIFVAIFAQATNDYRSIMAAETLCIGQIVRERYAASSETKGNLSGSVMATGPSSGCDKVELSLAKIDTY